MAAKINNYMLLIATVLLVFVLGIGVGATLAGQNTANQQKFVQAGWDAAKNRLQATGFISSSPNYEIKNIYGKVLSIGANEIKVKIRALEPLASADLDQRIVKIDDKTTFYKSVKRDEKEYQKELADVQANAKKMPNGAVIMPRMYDIKPIVFTDIKAGDSVSVAAESDIKSQKTFTAFQVGLTTTATTTAEKY